LKPKGFQSRFATADDKIKDFVAAPKNPAKGIESLWNPHLWRLAPPWRKFFSPLVCMARGFSMPERRNASAPGFRAFKYFKYTENMNFSRFI